MKSNVEMVLQTKGVVIRAEYKEKKRIDYSFLHTRAIITGLSAERKDGMIRGRMKGEG